MRDEFSTLDIVAALKIPRERLREWMNREFVKPSQAASGLGTKAIFSRNDVYAVALFEKLLEIGYKREDAAKELDLFYRHFTDGTKAILLLRGIKKQDKVIRQAVTFLPEHKVFSVDLDTGKSPGAEKDPNKTKMFGWDLIDCEWDVMTLINLRRLREKTDARLGSLGIKD